MIFGGCKSDELSKKEFDKLLPEIVGNEIYQSTADLKAESELLADANFENVTINEVEEYYRKALTRGGVYFIGFDSPATSDFTKSNDVQNALMSELRISFFVTGALKDQLTTVALKFGGVLYQLNDDFYIVKSGDENLLSTFKTSAVFVSTIESEQIRSLLTLYNLQGEIFGLQCIVRGSLLDLIEFQKNFKLLNQNKSVYLIDLAFIDFTIQESANFQAFLESKSFDLLKVSDFSELFAMYLTCTVDSLRTRNYYSQSLLASDGLKSTFNVGVMHSREERAITDQGTSTVQRYADVQDGFQLTFTPQNSIGENVICSLVLENSAFTDESYNTKSETNLSLDSVPFQLGKTYYVSSLTNINRKRNLLLFGLSGSELHRFQTCWCRVRKVK